MAWILYIALYIQYACKDRPHCEAVLPPLAGITTYIEAETSQTITPQDYSAIRNFIEAVTADEYGAFDKDLETLKKESPLMYTCFSAISKYEYEGFLRLKTEQAREILTEVPASFPAKQLKEKFEARVAKLSPEANAEFKTTFKEIFELLKDVNSKMGTKKAMTEKMKKVFTQMIGKIF